MTKKLYLPKPKRQGAEWSYVIQADIGMWESLHKVNGKLIQCKTDCPYCGRYGIMERCRIKVTLIGTDTTRIITFGARSVIDALKNIRDKGGSLKGVVITLRGKGGNQYELVKIEEPTPKKQLALWG